MAESSQVSGDGAARGYTRRTVLSRGDPMCKRVTCPTCNKPTWAGCGEHIEQALAGVPKDDRCTCAVKTAK